MLKYILTSLSFAIYFVCLAQPNTLRVTMTDGKVNDFYFSDEPSVTMSASSMILTTNAGAVELPLEKIQNFTYVEVEGAGILSPSINNAFVFENGIIVIRNADSDTSLAITNPAGIIVDRREINAGATVNVDLSNFASGVYVITINGDSFKILK